MSLELRICLVSLRNLSLKLLSVPTSLSLCQGQWLISLAAEDEKYQQTTKHRSVSTLALNIADKASTVLKQEQAAARNCLTNIRYQQISEAGLDSGDLGQVSK